MGSFLVLHASVTEYVLLFGTGIQTSGNSGKYTILSLYVERYITGLLSLCLLNLLPFSMTLVIPRFDTNKWLDNTIGYQVVNVLISFK